MALEGSMSPNKGCSNNLLDCNSTKHEQILSRLPCELGLKDQEIRSLEQTVQEFRLKCENKDKRILDLENEMAHIKIKIRDNKEIGDIKLLPNEPTSSQSVESLLETIRELKKALSLSKDSEALQKIVKENEEYKKKLRIQRYSDVPDRPQSQVQVAELQQDLQQFAHQCQAMYFRLSNTENIKSIPLPSMQNHDLLAAENEKLRAKVAEVTEMNKKWQMYNQQREAYVKKLCTLGSGASQGRTQEKTNQNCNISNVQKETTKIEEENLALKAQIKIFTEDFESERQDREKAQARVNDLEEELLKMKENQHEKNSSELSYSRSLGKYDYPTQQKLYSPQFSRMSKHGVLATDGCNDPMAPRSPGSPSKKLTCPSCMKIFEKQSELLEHVDICF